MLLSSTLRSHAPPLPYLHYRKQVLHLVHILQSLADLQQPSGVVGSETHRLLKKYCVYIYIYIYCIYLYLYIRVEQLFEILKSRRVVLYCCAAETLWSAHFFLQM